MKTIGKLMPSSWALPLFVSHLSWRAWDDGGERRTGHCLSIRVLCFALFVEWSR